MTIATYHVDKVDTLSKKELRLEVRRLTRVVESLESCVAIGGAVSQAALERCERMTTDPLADLEREAVIQRAAEMREEALDE